MTNLESILFRGKWSPNFLQNYLQYDKPRQHTFSWENGPQIFCNILAQAVIVTLGLRWPKNYFASIFAPSTNYLDHIYSSISHYFVSLFLQILSTQNIYDPVINIILPQFLPQILITQTIYVPVNSIILPHFLPLILITRAYVFP